MNKVVVADSSCIPSLRPKQNFNCEKCYICQDDKSKSYPIQFYLKRALLEKVMAIMHYRSTKKLKI